MNAIRRRRRRALFFNRRDDQKQGRKTKKNKNKYGPGTLNYKTLNIYTYVNSAG
jgi:hypothetical protein